MKFYKLTYDVALLRYNPKKKNNFGGVGAEIVKVLKKNDIVLVNRVEPVVEEKALIKKSENYYVSKNNFISVVNELGNPLSDKISGSDVGTFAIQKIQEPRTLIILGILGAVIIGVRALIIKK
jgi:hypothetical protein